MGASQTASCLIASPPVRRHSRPEVSTSLGASVLEFVGSMFYFYVLSCLYHKKSVAATGLLLIAMRCFPSVQDPEWLESSNLRKPSVVYQRCIGTENLWSESPPISGCFRTAGRGRIPTTRMLCGSSAPRHFGMILNVTATSHRKCRFPPPPRPIPTNDSYSWIKYTLCTPPQWLLDPSRSHSEMTKTQNQPKSSPSPGTRSPWPLVVTGRGSS